MEWIAHRPNCLQLYGFDRFDLVMNGGIDRFDLVMNGGISAKLWVTRLQGSFGLSLNPKPLGCGLKTLNPKPLNP